MARHVAAITAIYIGVTVAWVVLGSSVLVRTGQAEQQLHGEVADLWGEAQAQTSPELTFKWPVLKKVEEQVKDNETGKTQIVTAEREVWEERPVILDRSEIDVDLDLEQRRKGLLWYATYRVTFDGRYSYTHDDEREGVLEIAYRFPALRASYDDFRFEVDGKVDPKLSPETVGSVRFVRERVPVRKGMTVPFVVGYESRGLDTWSYDFGSGVSRVKDFSLVMDTDFDAIDFPRGTLAPDSKDRTPEGWRLRWASSNLISGFRIGMEMPHRLNPGPLAPHGNHQETCSG